MADPAPGISAVPHDDNLRYFDVAITGPEGSPFERMSCACVKSHYLNILVSPITLLFLHFFALCILLHSCQLDKANF